MITPSGKYASLLDRLRSLESVLVAYSGGVDSTLLAYAANEALGDRALAVLVVSELNPESEADDARASARAIGLPMEEVALDMLSDPALAANPVDRCYLCKRRLIGVLGRLAHERGFAHVVEGSNVDDLADHRPGARALMEAGALSPLREVGLTKTEIRELSRAIGLPTANRPSMACLASRFPYGSPLTAEGLSAVGAAEAALRELGFAQLRVRAHGDVARLEIEPFEMPRALSMRESISGALKAAGFAYAALDLEGYRTGSLNETLAGDEGDR